MGPNAVVQARVEASAERGPFFHGTRASLRVGDRLTAGRPSNYKPEVIMNHIYFTALRDGAGLAAEIAVMLGPEGAEPHVYVVEPTGDFEDDPNVTDKKFPGNPTRSYRTRAPMVVVEEITDWTRLSPEAVESWRGRLATLLDSDAEIVN
ncbi:NAD(+)--rifampin ADP-ribosyltransferase [Microbacterium sp. NPDC019599]|uniref:NAD(+)--rifampin ADP-ribosyltransferase n=1 Tax=Microbacterium sp. NPDC019599 TaxID=3154690 RepID=UPI0033C684C7